MFNQTFVEAAATGRKTLTVLASTSAQLFVLGVLLLAPLIYTSVLPTAQIRNLLIAPSPRTPAIPLRPFANSTSVRSIRVFRVQLFAPRWTPHSVASAPPDVPVAPDISMASSTSTAVPDGPGDVIGTVLRQVPPPPVEATPKQPSRPVRLGGGVAEANLIHKVVPSYPPLARSVHVQGTVEFTAIISKQGMVENLQLVHGHPLLVSAAREAVLQWRYRPTLLNGQPVEVLTNIVVNFTLNQ